MIAALQSKLADLRLSLAENMEKLLLAYKNNPGTFFYKLLYATFWFSIALFPIGYGFREVMPALCLIFLFMYYRHAWRESNCHHFKLIRLYICPLLMTLSGIIFSIHPWDSILHAGTGINKGFILPFIALECVHSKKDLQNLVWAFVFACFWEGLDGIYQTMTGHDFIMGYAPNAGRLTGSLGDYTVGNFMSLALIPASAVWLILHKNFGKISASLMGMALFWPGIHLVLGASTRSGMLAMCGALFLWLFLLRGWRDIYVWLVPPLIPLVFSICQPARLSPEAVLRDNRWDLWRLAWKIFLEHPWFGAGAGQYNAAFREMGLAPQREVITITHPHNLYLDLLYAHGLAGFILAMIFLGGFLIWGYRKIKPCIFRHDPDERLYWRIAAFFWLGYAGWLINGIFGHDFYRIWWISEAMIMLGIMTGAILNKQIRSEPATSDEADRQPPNCR